MFFDAVRVLLLFATRPKGVPASFLKVGEHAERTGDTAANGETGLHPGPTETYMLSFNSPPVKCLTIGLGLSSKSSLA